MGGQSEEVNLLSYKCVVCVCVGGGVGGGGTSRGRAEFQLRRL